MDKPPTVPDIPHAVQFARFFACEWQQELRELCGSMRTIDRSTDRSTDRSDLVMHATAVTRSRCRLHDAMFGTEAA